MASEKIWAGWREWIALPELGVARLKAKVDTGARSSALHTFSIELDDDEHGRLVRFELHPLQRDASTSIRCVARLSDERWVSDSGGHKELRPVIVTPITLGGQTWPIEVTLTNRDSMRFRMLLGRTAMKDRMLIDPGASYLARRKKPEKS